MKKLVHIIIIGLVVTGFLSWAAADEFTLTASVDKTQVGIDDQLTLTISASGSGFESLADPELPELENFEVVGTNQSSSSQFSIVNGEVSSSKTIDFLYYLAPRQTGKFQIRSAKMKYKGKTYTTDPITIRVISGSSNQQQVPRSPEKVQKPQNNVDIAGKLFVKAVVDKQQAFVGEQITVTFKLYKRMGLSDVKYQSIPSFTNFWVENLFDAKQLNFKSEIVEGVRFDVADLKQLALFPTTNGTFTLEPLSMSCQVPIRSRDAFNSFFGRSKSVTIKTDPISITVLPLPPGPPPDFKGAVGRFNISAGIDKTKVEANQPVTLTIRVFGAGNIKTLPDPVFPSLDDVKIFESGSTEKRTPRGTVLEGTKTYTYVLIPRSEGRFVIDPVTVTFFDTELQTYQTAKTRPFVISVTPGSAEEEVAFGVSRSAIELVGEDVRYIKPNVPILDNHGRFLYQSRLFQFFQLLPLLAIMMAFLYRRHMDRISYDVRYARLRRAHRHAQQRLKEADRLADSDSSEAFYACVSRAMTDYVGDKLNISATGITTEQLAQELEEKGISEEIKGNLISCLNECDFCRFAPTGRSKSDIRRVLDSARSIIRTMEKEKVSS